MPPDLLSSQPHFATAIRDSHSRLTFHDSNRNSFFTTHFRDYASDSHSRLTFATTLTTPARDSRSCPIRDSLFFCRDFRRATPPLRDGLC